MGFADYKAATAVVQFKGGSAEVRGLSTEDVSELIRVHLPDMEALFEMFNLSKGDVFADDNAKGLIVKLVKDAPSLAAQIVALASGEPDSVDNIRALPFPVMVLAVETVGRLTFEEVGGAKKFIATLKDLMGGLKPADVVAGSKKAR